MTDQEYQSLTHISQTDKNKLKLLKNLTSNDIKKLASVLYHNYLPKLFEERQKIQNKFEKTDLEESYLKKMEQDHECLDRIAREILY